MLTALRMLLLVAAGGFGSIAVCCAALGFRRAALILGAAFLALFVVGAALV